MKEEAFKNLAVRMLDTDTGIPTGAWYALSDVADAMELSHLWTELNKYIDGMDDSVFLKENHPFSDWKIAASDDKVIDNRVELNHDLEDF